MAWQRLEPAVSPVMDIGPPSQRRETRRKRVSSPRAAKRVAEPFGLLWFSNYGAWTRYFSITFTIMLQPWSLAVKAFARRSSGIRSKPTR